MGRTNQNSKSTKDNCFFSFPKRANRLWGPHNPLSNVYPGSSRAISGQSIIFTTYLYLVPRLWMSGCIPLFPLHTYMVWTRSSVDESCFLLGHYAVISGNSLKTFRDNILAPSSRFMNIFWFFTLEDRRSHLLRDRSRKSRPGNCTFIRYADFAWWGVLNMNNHQAPSECQLFIQFRICQYLP
jgi:hypothetical protein